MSYVKVRWQKRDDPEKKDIPEEMEEEMEERIRVERIAELELIKSSLVFDEDKMTVDFHKQRSTNCKHNNAVILHGSLSAIQEQ